MTLVTVDVFKVYYSKFRIIKKNLLDLSNVVWYLFVFPSFEIFKIKIILNDLKIYIYIYFQGSSTTSRVALVVTSKSMEAQEKSPPKQV